MHGTHICIICALLGSNTNFLLIFIQVYAYLLDQVEIGWKCTGGWLTASECFSICGDGLLRGNELCDDENTVSGDGCSENCAIEAGWLCSNNGIFSTCAQDCDYFGCNGHGICSGTSNFGLVAFIICYVNTLNLFWLHASAELIKLSHVHHTIYFDGSLTSRIVLDSWTASSVCAHKQLLSTLAKSFSCCRCACLCTCNLDYFGGNCSHRASRKAHAEAKVVFVDGVSQVRSVSW